ncbi:MAG TPA: c-type cytochrome biogenesis protein CcmI [Xanthobacteraceae bacterium]|jgi:cytochrome c-type biogenesis protein CcmH|nr:c-type cytochrome biogenesis protein CcmI [Xanthobacteraceae bacterium]
MLLWIIFAAMTAGAVAAVLWPLWRKTAVTQGGSDRLVYQDQLAEVARDRAAGLIGEAEAESARIEISRRLLASADAQAPARAKAVQKVSPYRRAVAFTTIVLVPVIAIVFYLDLGSPDVPSQSAFARVESPHGDKSMDDLVSNVEQRLARNPNDGTGWELIAPVYLHLGRYDDAVAAWRKAIALNGDNPARVSNLGEAMVAAADGVVKDDAKSTFQQALVGDPKDPKARYFLGLADEQDGHPEAAAAKWRALLDDAPHGAPWADFVRTELIRVAGQPAPSGAAPAPAQAVSGAPTAGPGPSTSDMAAANNMDESQRNAMIQGMVQRLADRLHSEGGDVESWLRLVRAYVVLGDRDKAKGTATDARRALQSHPDDVKQIDGLMKDLGLEG